MSHLVRICGSCDQPISAHTNDNNVVLTIGGFSFECYREWDTIGFSVWYDDNGVEWSDYTIIDGVTTLSQDYSGAEAQSGSDLIANRIAHDRNLSGIGVDDYYDPNSNVDLIEFDKVERWNDSTYRAYGATQSWVSTSILGETQGEVELSVTVRDGSKHFAKRPLDASESISNEARNAYVEGNEGFLSLKLLDEELTKKYHAHLLNVFLDKNTGEVRVGSIRLVSNTDGSLTAKCVNRNCGPNGKRASMTIWPSLATRSEQEDFILSIIAHGNNHAAAWFKSRDTFHKVHRSNCDLDKCLEFAKDQPHCPYTRPVIDAELNELEFLLEHQQYCNQGQRCTCNAKIERLMESTNLHVFESAAS